MFDKSKLKLLKWTFDSDWKDITSITNLTFTTLDVSFPLQSFCRLIFKIRSSKLILISYRFMLAWENVTGMVRQVYRRLTTYNVQFIAMQVQSIHHWSRYHGYIICSVRSFQQRWSLNASEKRMLKRGSSNWERSDILEMIPAPEFKDYVKERCLRSKWALLPPSGENFHQCLQVVGGIRLKSQDQADLQHLEERVMLKRFHSQHPPQKSGFSRCPLRPISSRSSDIKSSIRFCIEASSDDVTYTDTHSGYISFYKVERVPVATGDRVTSNGNGIRSEAKKRTHIETEVTSQWTPGHPESRKEDFEHLDDVLVILEVKFWQKRFEYANEVIFSPQFDPYHLPHILTFPLILEN